MAGLELKGVHTPETQERIKKYILGKLNQKEIDELWMEFIKAPKLFDYFMIELHLYALIKKQKRDRVERFNHTYGKSGITPVQCDTLLFIKRDAT